MNNGKIKLVIGFITYGKSTFKYLPYFLPSLKSQNFNNFKILCFDNSEDDNENIKYIRENYPEIEINSERKNFGFSKAYNKMINRAKETGAEYFLALNPDMILEKGAIAKMVEVLDKDAQTGSVCPKILRWDFGNNPTRSGASIKTDIIDSCGIKFSPGLNFIEIGQNEIDKGQYNDGEILGPSGAAAMYRMSALAKIKESDNYFDELMFMYKEDCDLDFRLFLAGFKSKLIYDAIVYHDRTASGKGKGSIKTALNRKNKSRQIKKWSFLNQQIIFIKYWNLQNRKNKLAIIWHEIKMAIFILLFEQYLLKEYGNLWRIRKKIKVYK